MSSIGSLLLAAVRTGIDRLDSQLLLLHALQMPALPSEGARRAWLLAHGEDAVPESVLQRFEALVQRRTTGEPVAYLTGHKEFFGLLLAVDARVLVPRPDTETLVGWALDLLPEGPEGPTHVPDRPASVLDLGTGSGAVALAIKQARPDVVVDAIDASSDALAVAQLNAHNLGLAVNFLAGNWFQPATDRYDCIVSNPPYVATDDPHLAALRHEPLQALVAGADGLQDLRTIVAAAMGHLYPGGWLLVEHGFDQGSAVRALFASAGFAQVSTRIDLAGHERCTGGRVIAGEPRTLVK